MRRASSSSLPAAVSKRHCSPLLYDRKRERVVVVADRERRLVAVAHDRVLGLVSGDEARARRTIRRGIAGRDPVAGVAKHREGCRAIVHLDRLHQRAGGVLGRRVRLLRWCCGPRAGRGQHGDAEHQRQPYPRGRGALVPAVNSHRYLHGIPISGRGPLHLSAGRHHGRLHRPHALRRPARAPPADMLLVRAPPPIFPEERAEFMLDDPRLL